MNNVTGNTNPQVIVKEIKRKIFDGELKVGDKLPTERALAETLGVSRSSVREAFKSLAEMGIVDTYQGGGSTITNRILDKLEDSVSLLAKLSGFTVGDVIMMRKSMEFTNLNNIIKKNNPAIMGRFQQFIDEVNAAQTGLEVFEIDANIHRFIAENAGNPFLEASHISAASIYEESIIKSNGEIKDWEESSLKVCQDYVMVLLDAIMARDIVAIDKALDQHYGYHDASEEAQTLV